MKNHDHPDPDTTTTTTRTSRTLRTNNNKNKNLRPLPRYTAGYKKKTCQALTPAVLKRRRVQKRIQGGTDSNGSSSSQLRTDGSPQCGQTSATTSSRQQEQSSKLLSDKKYGTVWVQGLRITVLLLLVLTMVFLSIGMYFYTRLEEQNNFESAFEVDALRIVERFHEAVEYKLGAMNTLSTTFTSYAQHTNQTFPNVTLPDFAMRGADMRIQSSSVILHYMPLVEDSVREEWEAYALENRFQIDEAFAEDAMYRQQQDAQFERDTSRILQEQVQAPQEGPPPFEIVPDGSGYHKHIWSTGALSERGDKPSGSGPYLPLWQRSPINMAKQSLLNMDFADTRALKGMLPIMQETHQAIINQAMVPIPENIKQFESNLQLSQYRNNIQLYKADPLSFIAHPVFDSFREDRKLVGVIAASIYWKMIFSQILPSSDSHTGIFCVLENDYNQTLTYRVDGNEATFLGPGDLHDSKYDYLEYSEDVNEKLQELATIDRQSYRAVSVSTDFGRYRLRVYPTSETVAEYTTNEPIIYSVLIVCAFLFTSTVFLIYSILVERRQKLVMDTAMNNATRAIETERELNEFLSHEIRNPVSAAMSACSFVSTTLCEIKADNAFDATKIESLKEDVHIIDSSLAFINDFLRSMLDLNRATDKKIELHLVEANLSICVIQPVLAMLSTRETDFEVQMDCPVDLAIVTDILRLKQVLLNLVRNSAKFVEKGFIRIKAEVVDGRVLILVQDSGPGIPADKRNKLFNKFQESLDLHFQGTGIGLSLCKSLVETMAGRIWLDEHYDSGIPGCPGTSFVIQTNQEPIEETSTDQESLEVNRMDSRVPQEESEPVGQTPEMQVDLPEEFSVLFVDDDNVLRKLFARAVKKVAPSWHIAEAVSGEVAIQLARTNHFDLILCDQYMTSSVHKSLLGTETARELRAQGYRNRICGLSANDLEEAFLKAGADCFLIKPFPCKADEIRLALAKLVAIKHEELAADQ